VGIDISGYAPNTSITSQFQDLYVKRFYIGIRGDELLNSRANGVGTYLNESHGFHLKSVQGEWADLFSQANKGDGLNFAAGSGGNLNTPFIVGLHVHANQGWGVNATAPINISKYYINFDKAGEVQYNVSPSTVPGTLIDGHIEEAGTDTFWGPNLSAPGIKVVSTSTSGLVIINAQINTNKGNGLELDGGTSQVLGSTILGNGGGAQAGYTHALVITGGLQRISDNVIGGTVRVAANTQSLVSNSISGTSSDPIVNFVSGVNQTFEGNFVNQAGAGTSITTAGGTSFYAPFNNNVFSGSMSLSGAVASQKQYLPVNLIGSETGANNAIAGAIAGVPLVVGLRVTVLLAHTLQAGANTFNFNGGGAVSIKRTTNQGDLAVAYASNGFITLMYNGTYWLDMAQ
jgi:hypothetical protein